jgi:murein DD-endopeptidase MepM/ murein hydrolase activator NlpD
MASRTFKVDSPLLHGDDVEGWQRDLRARFRRWKWDDTLVRLDGVYGPKTRAYTAKVLYGLGISRSKMKHGVTPALRTKVRHGKLSPTERLRMMRRASWRRANQTKRVAAPVRPVLADSWGWHPGVHDGLDLICEKDSPLFAMVRSRVIRVSSSGWWGKAPSGDVTLGDGIVMLECLDDVGPFRKGMVIGYGHAEHACVNERQIVKPGQQIALAGLAVVSHVHLMAASSKAAVGTTPDGKPRGVGTIDPEPLYRWAMKHA